MDILAIFVSAIFVNNILLSQFLGNCPYLGCSREKGGRTYLSIDCNRGDFLYHFHKLLSILVLS